MTANVFAEDRQRCIDAGMNDHLGKPVTPDRFYAILRRWLPVQEELKAGQGAGHRRYLYPVPRFVRRCPVFLAWIPLPVCLVSGGVCQLPAYPGVVRRASCRRLGADTRCIGRRQSG